MQIQPSAAPPRAEAAVRAGAAAENPPKTPDDLTPAAGAAKSHTTYSQTPRAAATTPKSTTRAAAAAMGSSASHAGAPPPPPPSPPPSPAYGAQPPFAAADAAPPPKPHEEEAAEAEQKVDYLNLPCPVPYEEIQREAFSKCPFDRPRLILALKPDLFEGMRFDFTKMINQHFSLSHSVYMGSVDVPSQGNEVIKIPTSNYEFGANFINQRMMLMGRVSHEGRENIRVKFDLTENLSVKINAQLTSEPHYSQGMFNFDYKGKDFRTQIQVGNNAFYGANYIQSVTKNLSLGTEAFWLGQQRKSGVGVVARYDTKKMVATGQIATTGMVALSYVQKVSEKVSLASDFMYNQMTKDVTASFGYDYILRQIDHWKKDYKFGFGMAVGE
ncbi:hypothetical protein HU200_021244 [Digitaria exilis]|uniref:Uncharacterized protein n=1 Tax=Digitaria exilis TaxID=1010633 RepID=A0A835K9U3_9POAL|nr:hypothetical protein HU200_021244 [Digitaria exilis]